LSDLEQCSTDLLKRQVVPTYKRKSIRFDTQRYLPIPETEGKPKLQKGTWKKSTKWHRMNYENQIGAETENTAGGQHNE
ncbi:11764_t:CDS:1, partial [Gigaspora rosea]